MAGEDHYNDIPLENETGISDTSLVPIAIIVAIVFFFAAVLLIVGPAMQRFQENEWRLSYKAWVKHTGNPGSLTLEDFKHLPRRLK